MWCNKIKKGLGVLATKIKEYVYTTYATNIAYRYQNHPNQLWKKLKYREKVFRAAVCWNRHYRALE